MKRRKSTNVKKHGSLRDYVKKDVQVRCGETSLCVDEKTAAVIRENHLKQEDIAHAICLQLRKYQLCPDVPNTRSTHCELRVLLKCAESPVSASQPQI